MKSKIHIDKVKNLCLYRLKICADQRLTVVYIEYIWRSKIEGWKDQRFTTNTDAYSTANQRKGDASQRFTVVQLKIYNSEVKYSR